MTLLLHACCAPCLSGARIGFEEQGIPFSVLWYNPNIQPEEERALRERVLIDYCSMDPFDIRRSDHEDGLDYIGKQIGYLKEGKNPYTDIMDLETRCDLCYLMRLLEAARIAKENDLSGFSTTLLLSRYQRHDRIRVVGEAVEDSIGTEFVYMDLRKYWGRSLDRSREYRLYRQRYCGCELSLSESKAAIKARSASTSGTDTAK